MEEADTEKEESKEEEQEIIVTYESLFDILRGERNKEELQKLHSNFFKDLAEYIDEKKRILEEKETQATLFSASEKDKTFGQVKNIQKIIRELYNRREKKIISMALNKSRTGSAIIDTSSLLEEEKEIFDKLVILFDGYRKDVLLSLLEGKVPAKEAKAEEKDFIEASKADKDSKTVRFLTAVPRFMGKELEQYGPFEEEDISNLPNEIADVLISKKRVEEI